QPVHPLCGVQRVEAARHLVGGEVDARRPRAPGPEGAVEAVALTGRGQHRLEDGLGAGRRGGMKDTTGEPPGLRLGAGVFQHRLVACRLEDGHLAYLSELGQRVGRTLDVHIPIISEHLFASQYPCAPFARSAGVSLLVELSATSALRGRATSRLTPALL